MDLGFWSNGPILELVLIYPLRNGKISTICGIFSSCVANRTYAVCDLLYS